MIPPNSSKLTRIIIITGLAGCVGLVTSLICKSYELIVFSVYELLWSVILLLQKIRIDFELSTYDFLDKSWVLLSNTIALVMGFSYCISDFDNFPRTELQLGLLGVSCVFYLVSACCWALSLGFKLYCLNQQHANQLLRLNRVSPLSPSSVSISIPAVCQLSLQMFKFSLFDKQHMLRDTERLHGLHRLISSDRSLSYVMQCEWCSESDDTCHKDRNVQDVSIPDCVKCRCSICLESMHQDNVISFSSCTHILHAICWYEHYHAQISSISAIQTFCCPMCRQAYPIDNV